MGRTRSFIQAISIDIAQKSHSCKHNKKHIINKGDKRLKIKEGRAFQHLCIDCAKESLQKDIAKLNTLLSELENIEGQG